MNQWRVRTGATVMAAALVGLSAGPATAATTVAQASASAVVVTLGPGSTGSGTYQVTNDGTAETANGNNSPAVSVLAGQSLVTAGTLAQDAQTSISDRNGLSAACSGLAGDGASVVAVGEGRCLTPGGNLSLEAGALDLSSLQLVQSDVLMGLDQQLQTALAPVIGPVTTALQQGLQTGLSQLGDPGIFLDLGAIQSTCQASPGSADGDADLADVAAYAQVAGTRVDLVSLPVHPDPNTEVVTGLDKVAAAIETALRSQLDTALGGALGPLSGAVDQAAVLNNVLAQISSQLAPLEQNVLRATLNKQSRPSPDAIEVTALDLNVLPAAAQFGVTALRLEVGHVTCGPNGRVAAPAVAAPTQAAPTQTPTTETASVPTSVPAGVERATPAEDEGSPVGTAALVALGALAVGAGVASYRRSLRS